MFINTSVFNAMSIVLPKLQQTCAYFKVLWPKKYYTYLWERNFRIFINTLVFNAFVISIVEIATKLSIPYY